MNQIPNLKYKTTLCHNWKQGLFCEKEDGCYFAHGSQDLRTLQQNRIAIAQRNKNVLEYRPIENYKTIFCKFYGKGECKLGEACTYAHERREKKIRKSNEISYEQQDYYAMYAYYAQINPWMAHLQDYANPHDAYQYSNIIEQEANAQTMKMSGETIPEQQEAVDILKQRKQKEGKFSFDLPVSQEIEEQYPVELNTLT